MREAIEDNYYGCYDSLADYAEELNDLALDLVSKASAFAGMLNPVVASSVGDLVRSMNCYYSNLIEGHDTHPHDIDRAIAEDYSNEPEQWMNGYTSGFCGFLRCSSERFTILMAR